MLTFTLAAVLGLTPILTGRQTPRLRIHRALVVAEFAAAILLLMSAELLARSWHFLQRVDPGFRADSVYTMNVRTPVGMAATQRRDFHTRLLKEISAKHGVSHAGFLSDLFIDNYPEKNVTVDGGRVPVRLQYRRDEAGGDAFQALGTRLLRGRFFSVYDRQDSPRVAIVNESMARRLWGASNPVGRKFRPGDGPWFTVVGVVADMRRQGIEFEPIPQMFEAITHTPSGGGVLILRTSAAHDASRAIQTAVRAG
jgi:putative ABC transport system permease protein